MIQVKGSEGVCFDDSAIFACTNFGQTYLNWEIVPPNYGKSSFPSFNSYWHPANFTRRDQAGSSTVVYKVISSNTSFNSVTATILSPASINGSRVTCNGRTLWLIVKAIGNFQLDVYIMYFKGLFLV